MTSLYAQHLAGLAKSKPWTSEEKLDENTVLITTTTEHSIVDLNAPKSHYVYRYLDPRPGKNLAPIYVGKGIGSRAYEHLKNAENPLLAKIIAKCTKANLDPIVEIVQHFADEADAFRLEVELIAKYGRLHLRTGTLCNLSAGGEGSTGWSLPPDVVKARLAKARKQTVRLMINTLRDPNRRKRSLLPRGKPYFVATKDWRGGQKGLSLGYRRRRGEAGTWTLRQTNGKEWTARVGTADDYKEADGIEVLTYWQARLAAERIVKEKEAKANFKKTAIQVQAQAIDEYLEEQQQ
jgi:hypothetical protein